MTNRKFFPPHFGKSLLRQHFPKPQRVKPQKNRIIQQPKIPVTNSKGTLPESSHRTTLQPPKSRKSPVVTKSKVKPKFRGSLSKLSMSRQRSGLARLLLSCLVVLILVVGISKITYKLVSLIASTHQIESVSPEDSTVPNPLSSPTSPSSVPTYSINLTQEIIPLKTEVQHLAEQQAGLTLGAFFVDLDTGSYLEVNAVEVFPAASMIKVPILVAFFQDVEAGRIHLDEMLTLRSEDIARGNSSGTMQYKPLGTRFTALETVTKMITISDNTATNMLISRLGGAASLNQRFLSWGLKATEIRNLLPDLSGTNTTTPLDLAHLMALVNHGDLVSSTSREQMLDIMKRTTIRSLLPFGLGPGATISHKTGDIGTLVGDVGLVTLPSGKRYIAVAMVRRPYNDRRAQKLIRQVSRLTYQQFSSQQQIPSYSNLAQ